MIEFGRTLPRPIVYLGYLAVLVASWGAIALLRLGEPGPADRTLAIHGVYDVLGHLLTALMIMIGLRAIRLPIPIWAVLIGGVVPDIGHVITWLDLTEPITGSSRNGTHSVCAVVVLALVGFLDRRHANVWLGITLGALSHLFRDMGTGTVPLAWPVLETVWGTSFPRYFVGILGVSLAMVGSGALLDTYTHANRASPARSAADHDPGTERIPRSMPE